MRTSSLVCFLSLLSGYACSAEPTFRVWGGELAMRSALSPEIARKPLKGNENGHLIVQVPVPLNGSRKLDPSFGKVIESPGKLLLCYRYQPIVYPKGGPYLAIAYTQIAEWSFPDIPSETSVEIEASDRCE